MKDIKSIVIAALLIIAGGGIAYFLFFSGGEVKQPKPEKVAKRVRIEIPGEEKKEDIGTPVEKTEAGPEAQKPAKGQQVPAPSVREEAKALTKTSEVKPADKKPEKVQELKPVPAGSPIKDFGDKIKQGKEGKAKPEIKPEIKTAQKSKEEVKPKEATVPEKKEVKTEIAKVEQKLELKKEAVKAKVEPKPEPKKEAAKKEVKNAQKGLWVVHIASYVTRDEAAAMQKKLKEDGYNAYISDFNLKGKQWYRLRVGFYATEDDAKVAGKKIAKTYSIAGVWAVKPTRKEVLSHN